MKVSNHRLLFDDGSPVPFEQSPNVGGVITAHEYLVMHFTAGTSARSSIDWLRDKRAKASAHLVIARDGSMTQLVPFNRQAWHAGSSVWGNRVGLNGYSLGIELDNAGKLDRRGSQWICWSGHEIPDEQVIVATHKNESKTAGWHAYTEPQIQSALEVVVALVEKYGLQDIVGHDDIAPGRKTDPGPAFPMASFRGRVLGRGDKDSGLYLTAAELNIRRGPGPQHDTVQGNPLPKGTRVLVQQALGNWRYVDVLDDIGGAGDLEGWVNGRYLTPA